MRLTGLERKYSGFPDTIRYCSPAHGGWGVVRMGMIVPESYQLFVCPFACGRHGAIGAIHQGYKHRLSYLYIDESDIVSGGYEELICEAVGELFLNLGYRPRVLMIFVSCLDDLLGTDHDAFLSELHAQFKDVLFTICHMNPITLGSRVPPPVNIQKKMFGLLENATGEAKLKNTAAFCGNNVPFDSDGELFEVLKTAGYSEVLHISECKTFSEFQHMARVSLYIVPSPVGLEAAKDLQKNLGTDYVFMPVSYDLKEIEDNYKNILDGIAFDFSEQIALTKKSLMLTKEMLGGMPVVIDASATIRPFSLACLLLQNGFKVTEIYAQECIAIEKASLDWIASNAPGVRVVLPEHHRAPTIRRQDQEILSIGFEAAYLTGARHVAYFVNDETLYGYHGIRKLMDMMVKASKEDTDLLKMINDYGLVV